MLFSLQGRASARPPSKKLACIIGYGQSIVKERIYLEFTHAVFSYRRSMQCLPRICGQYRPNRTPGTKSGVGACVRPARQSRDCLRGRPLRAPPLFAAVRPASGSVLSTLARARWRHFVVSPLCQSRFIRRKLAHPSASVRSMV